MKAAQWTVLGLLVCLFVVHLVGVSAQGAGKKDKTSFGATGATGAAVADEPGTAANAGENTDKKNKGSAKENVEVDSEKIKANKITSLKKLIEMYKKSDREGGQPSSMLRSLEKQLRNLEAGPGAESGEAAASGTDFDAQAEKMVAFRDIIRKDAQRVREEAVGPEDDDDSLISSSDPESESDEAVKARVAQGVQKLEEFKALPGVQEKNGIYFRRISEETEGKFATSRDRVHIGVKASTMTGAVVYDSKKDTIVSKHVTMNRLRTRMFKLYELATFVREGETLEALLPPDIAGTMKRINKSNFYESIPSQSTILVELTVNQISVYKRDEL